MSVQVNSIRVQFIYVLCKCHALLMRSYSRESRARMLD